MSYNMVPGTYALFSTSDYGAYYERDSSNDGQSDSIIANNNFDYNDIITVKSGEWIKLNRCYAVTLSFAKIDTSGSGFFRVGVDIKPGTYIVSSTSSYGGYYSIERDNSGEFGSIISNANFSSSSTVTVSKGQYLRLDRCRLSGGYISGSSIVFG